MYIYIFIFIFIYIYIFRPIHFMTPEKAVVQPSMDFMGNESSNQPMKFP